ncbi:(Acyl-carrier-protein) S-malonyltransferase [Candidatus Arthromitus sp. SFB-5]|nr:(Acyl-carrier-protein) S-malonyltransferase [Candidatus Arthromitus sp. SFB-5]
MSNVTADKMDRNRICELLSNQIMSSVLWEDSILKIIEMGIDTFVEIGPGRSLSSFVKKIDRRVTVLNIEDESSLNKSLKVLSGV